MQVISQNSGRTVVLENDQIILKYGPAVLLREAEVLKFIGEKTTIPVPKVIESYQKDDVGYIRMERIRGESLSKVIDKLSMEELSSVYQQLSSYLKQLKAIKVNKLGSFQSVNLDGEVQVDPYDNEFFYDAPPEILSDPKDYHDYWLERYRTIADTYHPKIFQKLLSSINEKPRFCHSDFSPRNIMVDHGKVTGILDWEFAGVYPESWESIRMFFPGESDRWNLSLSRMEQEYPIVFLVYDRILGAFF